MGEVERRFDLSDPPVGFLEHSNEQTFLVLKVVVYHSLARVRVSSDLVNTGTTISLFSELLCGNRQDVLPGHFWIVDTTRSRSLRRVERTRNIIHNDASFLLQ